jgi:hypothetical protein
MIARHRVGAQADQDARRAEKRMPGDRQRAYVRGGGRLTILGVALAALFLYQIDLGCWTLIARISERGSAHQGGSGGRRRGQMSKLRQASGR